jgi:uncharacterized protein (TIGR03086 family)
MAVVTERGRTVLLLEQAVGYGLGSVAAVTAAGLGRPTPCAGWTVADLLWHLHESMSALQEAPDRGTVALPPPDRGPAGGDSPAAGPAGALPPSPAGPAGRDPRTAGSAGTEPAGAQPPGTRGLCPDPSDPVAAVRTRAGELLAGWRRWAARPGQACVPVRVGGLPVPGETVALVGALELAVHGWDIAQACGSTRPIPVPLALAILRRAPQLADPATRPDMFAAPVPVPPRASPSDRLVAFLGRPPAGPADHG